MLGLDPRFVPWASWLLSQTSQAQVTSARRTYVQQARLWRRFRLGVHPFPVLPPGSSQHERGLAIDLLAPERELRRLGAIWRRAGGVWGGEHDLIHFEPGPAMLRRTLRAHPLLHRRSL